MSGWSAISANSTGNVPASDIRLQVGDRMRVRTGQVTTEANGGDGGRIEVVGGPLILQDGRITTSVWGLGNGGDILIRPRALLLDTGFIQANTSEGAKGGDIRVDTPILVIPGNQRYVQGGEQRQNFWTGSGVNVIQAAAPEGISGDIQVSAIALDLSGALFSLRADYAGLAGVAESPCEVVQGAVPSSLVRSGYGGFPEGRNAPWHGLDVPVGGIGLPYAPAVPATEGAVPLGQGERPCWPL